MTTDSGLVMRGENLNKRERNILWLLILGGCIIYSGFIVSELPNPDTLWNGVVYKSSWEWECSLGRYMIRIFQNVFDGVINPAAMTMLCIVVLAVLCVVMLKIFDINEMFQGIICGLLLLLTPAITGTLSYYYCSLFYCVAYLWAVIASWIMCKQKRVSFMFFAAIFICLSLATYQAYIGCTVVISFIYLLRMLLDNRCNWRDIVYRGFYIGITLMLGAMLYLVSNRVMQYVWNVEAEETRGFSNIGKVPLEEIVDLLKNCYIYIYQYFFTTDMINNLVGVINKRTINIAYGMVCLFILAIKIRSIKKGRLYRIAAVVGFAMLPLAVMFITIAASDVSIYKSTGMIMLPTVNYMYLLPILLLPVNDCGESGCITHRKIVYCVAIIVVVVLFNFSSAMQMYQRVSLKKMDYVARNIAYELDRLGLSNQDYKICIVGTMENGNYPELYPELAERVQWTTASYGTVWDDYYGTQACWSKYIKEYCGVSYRTCGDGGKYDEILESPQYSRGANFPEEGSIFIYEDSIIVIKLS